MLTFGVLHGAQCTYLDQKGTSMKNANMALAAVAALGIVVGLGRAAEVAAPAEPMSVWFVSPAKSFHESCPLGNGRLEAMDFGGVGRQRIVLNESSLWSGGPYDGNRYAAYQCLPDVRKKLFSGDISAAGTALGKNFRYADGVGGWMDVNQFGCYQTLGDLVVDFDNSPEPKLSSPSGHAAGDGKGIENTVTTIGLEVVREQRQHARGLAAAVPRAADRQRLRLHQR